MASAAPKLALTVDPKSEQPAASITAQSSSDSPSTTENSTLPSPSTLSSDAEREREARSLWARKMLEASNKLTHDQLVERVRKSGLQRKFSDSL